MSRAFIGLGSNQGDRLGQLATALQALGATAGVRVRQLAPIYETDPVGPPQPRYLNTVVELDTVLAPFELFTALKRIERQLGRVPAERWGPRAIDLDLLLYDEFILDTSRLVIPHPELHRRRFVLEPLAQLAPALIHPALRRTITELLGDAMKTAASEGAESSSLPCA